MANVLYASIVSRRRQLVLLLLSGVCLSGYWAWAVTPDPSPGDLIAYASHEYFPLVVEGWLQGRLDLPLPVSEDLLNLADPYDAEANEPFRYAGELGIHDLSLYQGRLYMYWSPAPALIAFLPWRLLTGSGLSTAWSVWAFTLGGWLFASMLLLQIVRRSLPQTGSVITCIALTTVGICNFSAIVLQRPTVYEVSISAAYFFTSLAWWQLSLVFFQSPMRRMRPLTIASLAFGLAVASRPSWIVASPVLLIALWDIRREWRCPSFRIALVRAIGPLSFCVMILLLLNVARFDDPLEFGMRYQLSAERPPPVPFELQHIPYSLYMYILAPPASADYFPFLLPSISPSLPSGHRGSENVFGLLPLLPILSLAALAFVSRIRGMEKLLLALTASFVTILSLLAMLVGVVMRYEMDLAPMLALLAAIGLLSGEDRWRTTAFKRCAFRSLWGGMLGVTFVMSFFAACSLPPSRSSPGLSRIALWANTIALHVGWSRGSVSEHLELEVMLPVDVPAEKEEVIMSTGRSPYHNVIYMRRPDVDHVVLGFHRGGQQRAESRPMAVDATVPHTLLLEAGSLYPPAEHSCWNGIDQDEVARLRSRVHVTLDDEVLLDFKVQQWGTVQATPVLGDLPLPGGAKSENRFTGTILRVFQHELALR